MINVIIDEFTPCLKDAKNWGVGSNRSNSIKRKTFLRKYTENWLVYKLGFFDY